MKTIFLILSCSLLFFGCSGSRPGHLGVREGKLASCPDSPNCVSTQAADEKHRIEPMAFRGSLKETRERLLEIIRSMKRAQVIRSGGDYIHAEFTSALFRFVDDGEFYLDETTNTVHMRSASRVGHSDLGVNRKRMEAIRAAFLRKE